MTGITAVLAGLPSAGGGGSTVAFTNCSVQALTVGSVASAQYRIATTGNVTIDEDDGSGFVFFEQWVIPTSASGDYEIYATETIGAVSSGPVGVWTATTSNITFRLDQTSVGNDTCELQLEVRPSGGGSVLDTWVVTLYAQRS